MGGFLPAQRPTQGPGATASWSVASPSDLIPYVSHFFVTVVDEPTEDILLNETALVQLPIRGDWTWRTVDGAWTALDTPTLFGPRGRALRIAASGPAMLAGFAIRPGGWGALDTRPAAAVADRVEPVPNDWRTALADSVAPGGGPADAAAAIIARLQDTVRARICALGAIASPEAALFEAMVRAESNTPVAQAASNLGMKLCTFDRFVRRHFGHAPKTVLRRSRFLDMAGVMHGLAAPDADACAAIRFYDASHLNREFRMFVDMTPGSFARAHTPLLNADLAARRRIRA